MRVGEGVDFQFSVYELNYNNQDSENILNKQ